MADFCCPKSIKAIALRVTRLDECDRPLDPLVTNSRILSSGFMELNLSPDIEGGEDITTKNGNGDICIRDKDCDRLKGFDVELKLCGVPIPLLEMLIDATILLDDEGNGKGFVLRESKDSPCSGTKMMELWSKNSGGNCSVAGNNLFMQWLLTKTRNWEISGSINFTIGALEVTLSGYAENNPNWFPSLPGADFPSYVPGGGDPASTPTGAAPTVLPATLVADTWTLEDQEAIQAGGPLASQCVGVLPEPINDCGYLPSGQFASA